MYAKVNRIDTVLSATFFQMVHQKYVYIEKSGEDGRILTLYNCTRYIVYYTNL